MKGRYDKGILTCTKRAEERYRDVCVGEEFDSQLAQRAFQEMRNGLLRITFGPSNRVYVLLVYDGSIFRGSTLQENVFKWSGTVCHQDGAHAFLVLMPQGHSALATETVLKHSRLAEDRLMAHSFEVGSEISLVYQMEDEHGNDRRLKSQKARLCTSKSFGQLDESQPASWRSTHAARGVLGPLPLVRVKDMILPVFAPGDGDKKLSPQQRLLQRGAPAITVMIEQLAKGLGAEKGDKILFVDTTANFASEWGLAVRDMEKRGAESEVLYAYLGMHSSAEEHQNAASRIQGSLMEWWDSQAEAGPKTRPAGAAAEPAPQLTLCAWVGDKPQLLPLTRSKFDNTDLQNAWALTMEQHDLKYGSGLATGAVAASSATTSAGLGPDWRAPPPLKPPRDVTQRLPAEAIETALVLEDCQSRAPAKRKALGVTVVNKEGAQCIYLDALEDVTAEPQELFGFNTGSFDRAPRPAGGFSKTVPFILEWDSQLVVLIDKSPQQEKRKTLMSLAQVMFQATPHIISEEHHNFLP